MAEVTVEVDQEVCIVSGMCASLAPEIFEIDDDGVKLEVLHPTLTPEMAVSARNAEACCPVEAITVVES